MPPFNGMSLSGFLEDRGYRGEDPLADPGGSLHLARPAMKFLVPLMDEGFRSAPVMAQTLVPHLYLLQHTRGGGDVRRGGLDGSDHRPSGIVNALRGSYEARGPLSPGHGLLEWRLT